MNSNALPSLVQEIEQFLLKQIKRIEHHARSLPVSESTTQRDLQSAVAMFEQERAAWEEERRAETEHLRQEGALLQEAWQRLEHEQRRLIADRELARRSQPAASGPSPAPCADPGGPADMAGVASEADDQSAWLQFQRMRREIQAHMHSRP